MVEMSDVRAERRRTRRERERERERENTVCVA